VRTVARATAALVEHKAREQAITIDLELAEELPTTLADPELLKTCLLNLVLNAFEAMPDGGRLRLAARLEAGQLLLLVSDTGVGLTADAVAHALEPYFSTKEAGVGLGLALVRRIVEGHGGTIALDSTPGRGTTVRLRLPIRAPAEALEPEAQGVRA
jgi:signal transduction histidine kinase